MNNPYFILGLQNEISTTHGMVSVSLLNNFFKLHQISDDLKIFGFFRQDTMDSIYGKCCL
jgi:hypothetical protein